MKLPTYTLIAVIKYDAIIKSEDSIFRVPCSPQEELTIEEWTSDDLLWFIRNGGSYIGCDILSYKRCFSDLLSGGVAAWNGDPVNLDDDHKAFEEVVKSIIEYGAKLDNDPTPEQLGINVDDANDWVFYISNPWGGDNKLLFAIPRTPLH